VRGVGWGCVGCGGAVARSSFLLGGLGVVGVGRHDGGCGCLRAFEDLQEGH